MTPRRYQLRKEAVAIVERHPWIFRDQLSSAASVFRDGDWLSLVDGANRVVGHGIYEAHGAVAIRVVRRGAARPDAAWLHATVAAAAARRASLAARTDGIRLVHGESDGLPAVVIDRFGGTLVAASYSAGADALARLALTRLPAASAIARTALRRPGSRAAPDPHLTPDSRTAPDPHLTPDSRTAIGSRAVAPTASTGDLGRGAAEHRTDAALSTRIVRGSPAMLAHFTEDGITYSVDLAGQKTGAYLDLRGLRYAIANAPLAGARVLNLFSYTGMLGRAAEAAGAASILQVDASERALALAKAHHVVDPARHAFVVADVFAWLPALDPSAEQFDLAIVDPPAMTSHKAQVPNALAAYRKIYRAVARHIRPGGAIVAACCTSRIERPLFHRTVRESLGGDFAMERELPPEIDHPVGFPQADYLKIAWWRRA